MKYTKKLLSLVLVLVLALALAVPGFAVDSSNSGTNDEDSDNYVTGKITIDNAVEGETYDIYRLLDLESYNVTDGAYSYKVASKWTEFFAQDSIRGTDGYVTIDKNGYVTWKAGTDSETAQAFAKIALKYAEDHSIDPDTPKDSTTVFDNIPLGYYLVDSSLGSLCALDTTNNIVTVYDKNSTPTLTKQVQEDDGGVWGSTAVAQIGQKVNFKLNVNTGNNPKYTTDNGVDANYVITDTLKNGMTYEANSIAISGDGWVLDTDVNEDGTPDGTGNYYVKYEGDILTITLYASKLSTLGQNAPIEITYKATLDKDATIAGDGNVNEATLSYHNQTTTPVATATVYTYSIGVMKTNSENILLNGAEFKLYDAEKSGNEIPVIYDKVLQAYRPTVTGEIGEVIKAGNVVIAGLDVGDNYYLEETKAPEGYNILDSRKKLDITATKNVVVTTEDDDGVISYERGGVQVINLTGTELPSTGGMGTTIFYTLGGVLVVGAAILLVTKKRVHDVEG